MSPASLFLPVLALLMLAPVVAAQLVVIDFEDMQGMPPPLPEGTPVDPESFVNDDYLARGVIFDGSGGGIALGAGSNPVSPPNVALATMPGPLVSLSDPVEASFWLNGLPGVVELVTITLTSSSLPTRLLAYDCDWNLVDWDSGGASEILIVSSPGSIHTVIIQDDCTQGMLPVSVTNGVVLEVQ